MFNPWFADVFAQVSRRDQVVFSVPADLCPDVVVALADVVGKRQKKSSSEMICLDSDSDGGHKLEPCPDVVEDDTNLLAIQNTGSQLAIAAPQEAGSVGLFGALATTVSELHADKMFFKVQGNNMSHHTVEGEPLSLFNFLVQRFQPCIEHSAPDLVNKVLLSPCGYPVAMKLQELSFESLANSLLAWRACAGVSFLTTTSMWLCWKRFLYIQCSCAVTRVM